MRHFFKAVVFIIIFVLIITAFLYRSFKIEYKDDIDYFAGQYGIDKHLVYALIKAESNYSPDARSNKDAFGLMQLTEQTADWCADKMNEPMLAAIFTEPKANIKIGCFYLSYLLERFDGDVSCALCAYNAGASNVEKWLKDTRYSPDGKTILITPFKETSGYLKKVMLFEKIYSILYNKR